MPEKKLIWSEIEPSDGEVNTLTPDRDFVRRACQSPSERISSSLDGEENNKRSSPKTLGRNNSSSKLLGKRKPDVHLSPPTALKIKSIEDLQKWPRSDTASTEDDSSPGNLNRPHHQIGGAAPPMEKTPPRSKQKHYTKANSKRSEEQTTGTPTARSRTVRNNGPRTAEPKRGDLKATKNDSKNPKNTEMKPLKNGESKLLPSDSKITDTPTIITQPGSAEAAEPDKFGNYNKPEVCRMVETENDVIFDESFDIWYTLPKGGAGHRGVDTASYEGGMHKIGTFTKVSEFFEFHRMLDWKTLPPNSVIAFCRKGVKPIWEDPANSDGGRYMVKNFNRSDSEAIFTKTALGFFSGMLHDWHNYNLVSLHIRDQRRGNDIQLWRSTITPGRLSPQVVKADILAFTSEENPAGITVAFVPNRYSMERNDSRLASKTQCRWKQQNNIKYSKGDNLRDALDSLFGAGASDICVAKNVSALYSRKNRPSESEPQPLEPRPSEPQPLEPRPSEPQPLEPRPSEPRPSKPRQWKPRPSKPQPSEPRPWTPQPSEPRPSEPQPAASLDVRYGYNSWPYPNTYGACAGAAVLAANVKGGEQAVAPGHSTWTIGMDPYYYNAAQGTPTAGFVPTTVYAAAFCNSDSRGYPIISNTSWVSRPHDSSPTID